MNPFQKISLKNEIILHILVWLMLFSVPYLLASGDHRSFYRIIEHTWIPLLFYGLVFYLNYWILIDKYFFTKKHKHYIIFNLLIILVFFLLLFKLKHLFSEPMLKMEPPKDFPNKSFEKPSFTFFIYLDLMWFLVPIAFAFALRSIQKLIQSENDKKEAEKIKLEHELQYLRYQLQPHFFFNSLNNIYSLVDISPEKAKESIHALSKLMRFLLYESNINKVELKKEIEFMTTYIELMKLRYSDKTSVSYHFPNVNLQTHIPPLLFISLIENGFKHGVSATKQSFINFEMVLENNTLIFKSKNSYFPKNQKDKSGSGIGLVNLSKRLKLLYNDNFKLNTKINDDVFEVDLIIELDKQN